MWNNEFKQRSAGLSEWLLICQFTVTAGRDKSTVGMWSVFRGFQLRVWPDSQRAFIQLSLQTPKLPEHRSIFSLMHTVPQSIWPIADFLVFAHLSHFNVSDHNKTKGLIPKHLTSWQDNRWVFWTVCVIRRTSYQQSHMLALVRLVRGCFAALGVAVFAYSMEPWVLLSSRITRMTDNDPKHTTKSSSGQWRT